MLAGLAQLEFDILGLNSWWIGLTDQGHEGRYHIFHSDSPTGEGHDYGSL